MGNDKHSADKDDWSYLTEVRSGLVSDFRRWSDGINNFLILGNTGGIALVATMLGSVNEFRDSYAVKSLLTLFVLGALAGLLSLYHEWSGVKERLQLWDSNTELYRQGKLTVTQVREKDAPLAKVRLIDRAIGWAPGAAFVSATLLSLLWIWLKK